MELFLCSCIKERRILVEDNESNNVPGYALQLLVVLTVIV